MTNSLLYIQKRTLLETRLQFLNDKPEETVDSTLKALWFAASGKPRSAEEATKYPLPELTERQVTILDELIEQRLNKIPLAHITKRQSFMGIELLADTRALIPRKETELLGRKALDLSLSVSTNKGSVTIIDLCCGSGNLGLAIAYYNPLSYVFAGDISSDAIDLARDNIALLNLHERVKAVQSDLFEAFNNEKLHEKADLIVCNPPYISSFKVTTMDSEISSNEPSLAFDGGMIGLKIIQRLIRESPKYLKPHEGWLLFEVGAGQGNMIMELCERTGLYSHIEPVKDDLGNIRVVSMRRA